MLSRALRRRPADEPDRQAPGRLDPDPVQAWLERFADDHARKPEPGGGRALAIELDEMSRIIHQRSGRDGAAVAAVAENGGAGGAVVRSWLVAEEGFGRGTPPRSSGRPRGPGRE